MALKRSNSIKMIFICLCVLFWSLPSYAINIKDISNPRQTYGGWIADEALIISEETEVQLNQEISQLKSSRGIELAIVTVPDISPSSDSKSFATKLFNYWEIGEKKLNNGILLLVAVKEHRLEIETGSGITKAVSASQISQIIDSEVKSRFEKGKFDLGISKVTEKLIVLLKDNIPKRANSNFQYLTAFIMLGSLFLIGLVVNLYEKFQTRQRPPLDLDESLIHKAAKRKNASFNNAGNSSYIGGGSSDGGGSFGGFGGGSSDGGGDGGSW